MKKISVQLNAETIRQMEQLASLWGLPPQRHSTAVIERSLATVFMFDAPWKSEAVGESRQISIEVTDETGRQIDALAAYWGLPSTRYNTPVIERAVTTVYMYTTGSDVYRRQLIEMGGTPPGSQGGTSMNTTTIDQQVPALLRHLENALRSGYNIRQAFEIVASDLDDPLAGEARRFVEALEAGTPLPEAIQNWVTHTPSPDLDLALAAISQQVEVGGNLADKFNLLGQIMAKRAGV